jgi:hypothetical protein
MPSMNYPTQKPALPSPLLGRITVASTAGLLRNRASVILRDGRRPGCFLLEGRCPRG